MSQYAETVKLKMELDLKKTILEQTTNELELLKKMAYDFRQDGLKVIWDEIERGVHKEPMAVLLEVIRIFDVTFEPQCNSKNETEKK